MTLQHKFVDTIPEIIEYGTIYISLKYKTAIHKCICGCNNEVVTPISPTDWQLTFNGISISLSPSIGNWNFPCKSHYWIVKNEIVYSVSWNDKKIKTERKKTKRKKKNFLSGWFRK